jgi:murein L,D-transpeptidase YcbB/YkuD
MGAAIILYAVLWAAPSAAASTEAIQQAIAERLANSPAEVLGFDSREVAVAEEDRELYAVYHEFGLQPLWMVNAKPVGHARALLDAISNAHLHGLRASDYHLDSLQQAWDANNPEQLAKLDLLLTLALLAWVNDASEGRIHPRQEDPALFATAGDRREDPVMLVNGFLAATDPVTYLDNLHPQHFYYRGLQQALPRYRELATNGGWPAVSEGDTLHPGDSDPRVAQLRRRLAVTGEFSGADRQSALFDEELRQAVIQFQLFHGLDPDGVAGARTIAEMNVPAQYRVRQIEMNMERWRWADHDLGNPYVMVDIAAYDVQGVVNDRPEIEMRVIVGKLHHETPVFSDKIRYIEFNPYWNLTPSIARHETVPKIRRDPDYLASKHIRVFDGWGADARELDPGTVDWEHVKNPARFKFRQDPGPWNALGTMKFIFPNQYSVYLHDTPNHDLFAEAERSFSHGCIRLSEPAQLAEWMLGLNEADSDWDLERIQGVLDSQQRTVKNLSTPLAVHLTYETAWIDGDARLRFAPDVYGRDGRLEQALYGNRLME